jgi:hypothetical protein
VRFLYFQSTTLRDTFSPCKSSRFTIWIYMILKKCPQDKSR